MSDSLGATRSGTTAFGTALRSMRLAAGLSQGALAERAGLSEKAVGALERGDRTTPRPATVALLADAVGASPAERDRLLAAAHAEERPTDTDAASLAQRGLLVPPTPLLGRQQDIAAVSHLVSPPDGAARCGYCGPGWFGRFGGVRCQVCFQLQGGRPPPPDDRWAERVREAFKNVGGER